MQRKKESHRIVVKPREQILVQPIAGLLQFGQGAIVGRVIYITSGRGKIAVDIDDPRLEEARMNLKERIEKYDDRILATLKGHLSAEQNLNDLLRAAKRRWRGRSFAGKIDVAQRLFLPDLTEELWEILRKGNDLRNAVAHGHKEGTITQRMADLKKALLAWSSPEQRPGIEAMTDTQMVSTAFYSTGSFLIVAALKREGKY